MCRARTQGSPRAWSAGPSPCSFQLLATMQATGAEEGRSVTAGSSSALPFGRRARVEATSFAWEAKHHRSPRRTPGPWGWRRGSQLRCSGSPKSSSRAMRALSSAVRLTPSRWVPSRSVVSKALCSCHPLAATHLLTAFVTSSVVFLPPTSGSEMGLRATERPARWPRPRRDGPGSGGTSSSREDGRVGVLPLLRCRVPSRGRARRCQGAGSPRDALGSIPIEPGSIAASSERMSPKRFSVRTTSNLVGT